jgi:hypothetical protein
MSKSQLKRLASQQGKDIPTGHDAVHNGYTIWWNRMMNCYNAARQDGTMVDVAECLSVAEVKTKLTKEG